MVDAHGSGPCAPYTGIEVQILSPALDDSYKIEALIAL